MGGERCFYSGADSASATGAAGRSDLEGLLSVSMGSSVGGNVGLNIACMAIMYLASPQLLPP